MPSTRTAPNMDKLVTLQNTELDVPNIAQSRFYDVADTGTIDTEFAITHDLGYIPTEYVLTKINKKGFIYFDAAGTAWTNTTVYFKCSIANAAVRVRLY